MSGWVYILVIACWLFCKLRKRQAVTMDTLMRIERLKSAQERGKKFEYFCANLLKKNGFHHVRVSGRAGDQGVDVVAWKGLKKYAIQCKCYSRALGNGPVQEINAGMEIVGAHIGVVMTNSSFTRGAREAAKLAGRDKPILLWGREEIRRMMK